MTIAIINSAVSNNTNPSTYRSDEMTFTRPSGMRDGDMLVMVIGVVGTQGSVDCTGWTTAMGPDKGSPDRQIRLMYKVVTNAGGEPYSYQFNISDDSYSQGTIMCLRGAYITPPTFIRVGQGDDDPVGSNMQCPSVTTTFDEAFILACAAICDTSGSPGSETYGSITGAPSMTKVLDGVPALSGEAQRPESGGDQYYIKVGVAYAQQIVAGVAGGYGWAVPYNSGDPDGLRDGAEICMTVAIKSIVGYEWEDDDEHPDNPSPTEYKNIDVLFEGEYYPFNYNPVHAIWQCLLRVGLPETWMNDASFLAAAITVYTEGIGVALLMRQHQSCLVYLKSLLAHINAIMYYGTDGELHIKLVRDDYTIGTLPTVSVEELLGEPDFERGSWLETIGEVQIQYNQITAPEIVEDIG